MNDIEESIHLIEYVKLANEDIVLITDFCNGCDFHDLIYIKRAKNGLSEVESQRILIKVANGLE